MLDRNIVEYVSIFVSFEIRRTSLPRPVRRTTFPDDAKATSGARPLGSLIIGAIGEGLGRPAVCAIAFTSTELMAP